MRPAGEAGRTPKADKSPSMQLSGSGINIRNNYVVYQKKRQSPTNAQGREGRCSKSKFSPEQTLLPEIVRVDKQ